MFSVFILGCFDGIASAWYIHGHDCSKHNYDTLLQVRMSGNWACTTTNPDSYAIREDTKELYLDAERQTTSTRA